MGAHHIYLLNSWMNGIPFIRWAKKIHLKSWCEALLFGSGCARGSSLEEWYKNFTRQGELRGDLGLREERQEKRIWEGMWVFFTWLIFLLSVFHQELRFFLLTFSIKFLERIGRKIGHLFMKGLSKWVWVCCYRGLPELYLENPIPSLWHV